MTPTKAGLRKLIGRTLRDLSEENKRIQSESIAQRLFQHPKYLAAKGVSLYLSTKNEVDTLGILRRALEVDHKRCYIPYIKHQCAQSGQEQNKSRMKMIEIKSIRQYESLPENKYGIKEPEQLGGGVWKEAEPNDFELMLVPGVAFSLNGRRLGHGKGYYDEYLAQLQVARQAVDLAPVYCIGLALKEQIVAETLAQEGHDYVLDEVLVGLLVERAQSTLDSE